MTIFRLLRSLSGPSGAQLERRSVPSLRRPEFEDEDDDEYENEVPHENCKEEILEAHHWAASAAVIGEK